MKNHTNEELNELLNVSCRYIIAGVCVDGGVSIPECPLSVYNQWIGMFSRHTRYELLYRAASKIPAPEGEDVVSWCQLVLCIAARAHVLGDLPC